MEAGSGKLEDAIKEMAECRTKDKEEDEKMSEKLVKEGNQAEKNVIGAVEVSTFSV